MLFLKKGNHSRMRKREREAFKRDTGRERLYLTCVPLRAVSEVALIKTEK